MGVARKDPWGKGLPGAHYAPPPPGTACTCACVLLATPPPGTAWHLHDLCTSPPLPPSPALADVSRRFEAVLRARLIGAAGAWADAHPGALHPDALPVMPPVPNECTHSTRLRSAGDAARTGESVSGGPRTCCAAARPHAGCMRVQARTRARLACLGRAASARAHSAPAPPIPLTLPHAPRVTPAAPHAAPQVARRFCVLASGAALPHLRQQAKAQGPWLLQALFPPGAGPRSSSGLLIPDWDYNTEVRGRGREVPVVRGRGPYGKGGGAVRAAMAGAAAQRWWGTV